ncbi:MAG: triosephosphate isomerase [Sphingobacteriales bacterium]|jgi:triosephosphate isomerase
MRKKIVAGNWKMNTTYEGGLKLASEIINMVQDEGDYLVEVILAPPYTHLSSISKLIPTNSCVKLGAQNCHLEDSGAFTGEVSLPMLESIGVNSIILGHSERRKYYHESDKDVAKKTKKALDLGISPIICVGETEEQRAANKHFLLVKKQLEEAAFHTLNEDEFSKVIIAYEPVWAIGTGKTASPEQAQEMHQYIRKCIAETYSISIAEGCTILYGGSCNEQSAENLFSQPDIDGGLIGGSALKSREFMNIIKILAKSPKLSVKV